MMLNNSCSKFQWASKALSAVSNYASEFEQNKIGISNSETPHILGLQAAWKAWCDVENLYSKHLLNVAPLHSKCVGFTSG